MAAMHGCVPYTDPSLEARGLVARRALPPAASHPPPPPAPAAALQENARLVEQLTDVQRRLHDTQVELQDSRDKLALTQEYLTARERQVEQLQSRPLSDAGGGVGCASQWRWRTAACGQRLGPQSPCRVAGCRRGLGWPYPALLGRPPRAPGWRHRRQPLLAPGAGSARPPALSLPPPPARLPAPCCRRRRCL
jgi:hypothetical protein